MGFSSTMFVKGSAARFTEPCGCSIMHEKSGHKFYACVTPCERHYDDAEVDELSLYLFPEGDGVATLDCGCNLDHKSGGGTSWVLCAEHQAVYDEVTVALGFTPKRRETVNEPRSGVGL